MSRQQTLEELRTYENEYRQYRQIFETDGVLDRNEQARLAQIENLIRQIRQSLSQPDSQNRQSGQETSKAPTHENAQKQGSQESSKAPTQGNAPKQGSNDRTTAAPARQNAQKGGGDDETAEALAMFDFIGGGIGVMPDPDDNPNNHVVPHHESGTRISFEVLNVGNAGGEATVDVYINGKFVEAWQSRYLNPGEREVGYVSLGRLSEGRHKVEIYLNPSSGRADYDWNEFDVQ
jgi:hypothetical protein